MSHIPVLLEPVLRALSPRDGACYLDGTFGAGGYSRAILSAADCSLIGLDRDPSVAPFVKALRADYPDHFQFVRAEFSDMQSVVSAQTEDGKVDGIVLDVGVSSMQLDQEMRGFSFMREGPLDMRMSSHGVHAGDAIKYLEHNELIAIFKVYGEEKRARRCADFIVRAREEREISTTIMLADILASALGRSGKKNPATRVFQALRIYINDELGELRRALDAAENILRPGGRLVVVSFHSLEDRMVKKFFKERCGEKQSVSRYTPIQADVSGVVSTGRAASFDFEKRSGISATSEEEAANPRARSARLRYGIRNDNPAFGDGIEAVQERGLEAQIPSLAVLAGRVQ